MILGQTKNKTKCNKTDKRWHLPGNQCTRVTFNQIHMPSNPEHREKPQLCKLHLKDSRVL